jgi:hypothetical protein
VNRELPWVWTASSVTQRRNCEVQGSREGAVEAVGMSWVDLAVYAIVFRMLGVVLKLGIGWWWWLTTALTLLMAVSTW